MKKTSSILIFIFLITFSYSQDIFLKGKYIEVGVHPSFSFGGEELPPNDYHAKGKLGFICDYNKDGWETGDPPYMGDYFIPGAPEEGWGIEWSDSVGNSVNYNNFGLMNRFELENTYFEKITTSYTQSALWKGEAISGNAKLNVEQIVLLKDTDLYITITTTLNNTGTDTLYSVEYFRNVDPDHEVQWEGGFPTNNFVKYQPGVANNEDTALVVATGIKYGIPLMLGATDSRAKVSVEGFSNRDPDLILDNPVYYSETSPCLHDIAICLAFRFGNLAPGDSITFNYFYGLNYFDISQVSNSILCSNMCNDSIAHFKLSSYLEIEDILWKITNLESGITEEFNDLEINYLIPEADEYKISAFVNYEDGKTKTIDKTFTVYPKTDLGPDTYETLGDVITLNAGSNYLSYDWSIENQHTNLLKVDEPGIYSVLVEDFNNCFSSDSIEITCSEKVKSFDYKTPCFGLPTSFYIFNCGEIKAVRWDFGDNSSTNISNEINPEHAFNKTGKFSVELDVYFYDNTNVEISQEIEILQSTVVNLGNDTSICANSFFNLDAGSNHLKYFWSDNSSDNQYTTVFTPGGIYSVTATDTLGCISTDEIKVVFAPQLKEIETEFATCINNEDGKIIVKTYETFGNILYKLDDDKENNTGVFEKIRGGDHTIKIINENCEIEQEVHLNSNMEVDIPNIFTPNYDDINDFFKIEQSPLSITKIESYDGYIFNRFGDKLFYFTDEMNKWDGTYLGKEVPDGVYFYIINVTNDEDKKCIYNGILHLYR